MGVISGEYKTLDEATWFLGIHVVPRKGIALADYPGAGRDSGNGLRNPPDDGVIVYK